MPSQSFIERGGTDAEYEIYRALLSTGRREPQDFKVKPPASNNLSFIVYAPRVGIKVGIEQASSRLLMDSFALAAPRVEYITESRALDDARGALREVLGG